MPWLLVTGWSHLLMVLALATAGVCVVLAVLGLAVGLWIQEPVRGSISAVSILFFLLFATDLVLILVAGSPMWVAPLMANPMDASRITVLLTLEHAAFSTLGSGALVTWWTAASAGMNFVRTDLPTRFEVVGI